MYAIIPDIEVQIPNKLVVMFFKPSLVKLKVFKKLKFSHLICPCLWDLYWHLARHLIYSVG